MTRPACRLCRGVSTERLLDLGVQPLANSILRPGDLDRQEPMYPLVVQVCLDCWLVQLEDFARREEIFHADYSYFSSFSTSWLEHAARYATTMIKRLHLGPESFVVEVASNDGYLLKNFVAAGIPVLGVEPSDNVAAAAIAIGVPSKITFFGRNSAADIHEEHGGADLIVCNNVLAHVPDLHDFVGGLAELLKPDGVITIEAPHLLRLLEQSQFDTIYHEHYSYFSLSVLQRLFARFGLEVVDVEELPAHGGSLRMFVLHQGVAAPTEAVSRVVAEERAAHLEETDTYIQFQQKVQTVKEELLAFLADEREGGRSVVAYGAPAKGNTLLNYCGVGTSEIAFTVDASPHKQGHLLPGSHLPIRAPQDLLDAKPDTVLILPWNLRDEIMNQMRAVLDWGGHFAVAVPRLAVLDEGALR